MVLSASITAVLKTLEESPLPVAQQELRRTIDYAGRLYGGAVHWTGLTLLEHALGVLQRLLPFQPDADTVNACILMHAIETGGVSLGELEQEFGARVRQFVSAVHLLSHVNTRVRRGSIEELRLMLLSVADDVRVLLIILCKRCFALERAEHLPVQERKHVARDVLSLFAPVAARLGIHSLKQKLEALAFPIVYPADAERIAEQVAQVHERHGPFLEGAALALKAALAEQGIDATVQGREKQFYSIFGKMQSKSVTHIDSLPDLFALRVIVQTEEECYRALGVLHRISRPVPNRFKDYIAFPKPNAYQSLHTTLARMPGVPEGLLVEVQVRTPAMHREAEFGIAAHWSYKEGGSAERSVQRVAMQQALASQHALEGASTAMPHLADHIFVLTPAGDIVELPEGATPLDFAFQIHTQLGLSFRSARVNGSIVPLDYELENGDMIEILTQKTPKPSPEWLQLLKMASSRSRLKRYLAAQHRDEYIAHGRAAINAELRELRQPPLDADASLMRLYDGRALNVGEREDLLMKIGQGSDRVGSLLQRLDLLKKPRVSINAGPKKIIRMQRKDSLIELEGSVPMPATFAKCCKPNTEDHEKLLGIITRGGGVMVHGAKCKNALRGNPERRIGVRWRK